MNDEIEMLLDELKIGVISVREHYKVNKFHIK